MARVVLENISKTFLGPKRVQIQAVRDFSIEIQDQEFMVLVGPSGCGKTTILRLIAGLEELTSGIIRIGHQEVSRVEPKDRDVAMVFQNYALYPHMTVYENMAFSLKLRKFSKGEIDLRVRQAAETLELGSVLNRLPPALSGGQRQRVAVGRAIVRQPKAFLFDEPLSNLDAKLRAQMRLELRRLHRQLAATMIYVTHDQVEAMTLGDRIAVINDGMLQQVAEPLELYHHPANLFVAAFLGWPPMNFFHGIIETVRGALWFEAQDGVPDGSHKSGAVWAMEIPSEFSNALTGYLGRSVTLGMRPEDIQPVPVPETTHSSRPNPPEQGTLPNGTVELLEPMGAESFLHLAISGGRCVVRVPPTFRPTPGDRFLLQFHLERAVFFDPETGNAIR